MLAALFINLYLLIFIISRAKRALPVFVVGAVVQVALYAPWLVVFINQAGVVSGSYWANVSFPRTIVEWLFYPVYTSNVIFADTYGFEYVVALTLCAVVAIASALYGLVHWWLSLQAAKGKLKGRFLPAKWALTPSVLPALWGVVLYVSVFASALVASIAMDSLIVYYRYLCVTIGPLLFAVALCFLVWIARCAYADCLPLFLESQSSIRCCLFMMHTAARMRSRSITWRKWQKPATAPWCFPQILE